MKAATDIARPILKYYGGKWNIAPWIISHFPQHSNYVETCGGAASVLLQKPRSPLETYNDLDGNVVNFFRMLRENTEALIDLIRLTPWSRQEFEICRDPGHDELEAARRFFISSWMSISCQPHDKTTGFRTNSYAGQAYSLAAHNYLDVICPQHLQKIADRFAGVQIEHRSAEHVIVRYDHPDTLIYFDPPYVTETRTNKKQYLKEVSLQFHRDASILLRQASGYVVVSGYACPLYGEIYEDHGWQRVDKETLTNGGSKRVESLWLSPRTVDVLNRPQQLSLLETVAK